ncbi:MAG: hypothetical protein ACK5AZ_16385 [Bryobacteraceae bacterium]
MSESPVQKLEKLTRIWSEKKEKQIAVRVQYEVRDEGECKILMLNRIEEL